MRKFLFLLLFLSLSGCAGLNLGKPGRWVENNTLYSTNLPSIEVKVVPSLPFKNEKKTDKITDISKSTGGASVTGKDIESFQFVDDSKQKALIIKLETLTNQTRWYMEVPDYSRDPSSLISTNEIIGGINYSTGILREKYEGKPFLVKAYGAVVGETTRYQVILPGKCKCRLA
jgi:hypothetical protein